MFDQNAIKTIAFRAGLARASGQNVPSPCVAICHMDAASGLCAGCLRTLDEIALWSHSSDTEKQRIWAALAQRANDLNPDPQPAGHPTESDL